MTNDLIPIAPVQRALALAVEAEDIGKLRDVAAMATALQKGAQARGLGVEAENVAADVILRAERAMGKLLRRMADDGTRARPGATPNRPGWMSDAPTSMTLKDLGLDRRNAALYQRLAAEWSDEQFDEFIAEAKALGARIAKIDFYRGPKRDIARDKAVIREAAKADDAPTSPWAAFKAAADTLLNGAMTQMPDDELISLAKYLQGLVQMYQATKAARS